MTPLYEMWKGLLDAQQAAWEAEFRATIAQSLGLGHHWDQYVAAVSARDALPWYRRWFTPEPRTGLLR